MPEEPQRIVVPMLSSTAIEGALGPIALKNADSKIYAFDWNVWPQQFRFVCPMAERTIYGIDFVNGIVLDKSEETPGLYSNVTEGGLYAPYTSLLRPVYLSEYGRLGWWFSWRTSLGILVEWVSCVRVLNNSSSTAFSPVGDYFSFTENFSPPYSIMAVE